MEKEFSVLEAVEYIQNAFGLTKSEIQRRMGFSPSVLSGYLRGQKKYPSAKVCARFKNVFGIKIKAAKQHQHGHAQLRFNLTHEEASEVLETLARIDSDKNNALLSVIRAVEVEQ